MSYIVIVIRAIYLFSTPYMRSTASALVVLEDSKSTALWNKYVIFPEIILYLSLFLMTNT